MYVYVYVRNRLVCFLRYCCTCVGYAHPACVLGLCVALECSVWGPLRTPDLRSRPPSRSLYPAVVSDVG